MSSYQNWLKTEIERLQWQIETHISDRDKLIAELERLKMAEFEEDMRNEGNAKQQTLFG